MALAALRHGHGCTSAWRLATALAGGSSSSGLDAASAALRSICSSSSSSAAAHACGPSPSTSAEAGASGAASASPSGQHPAREQMKYDVLIVGAGPAGLAAAIRFKKRCKDDSKDLSVCVVEKGAAVGSHILSGNVLETKALDELLPDWQKDPDCPIKQKATSDAFVVLAGASSSFRLPTPGYMRNKGKNYVVSLSEVTRWLAAKAEELGVEIYPGFAGKQLLTHWDGHVEGVATNDMGVGKDGRPRPNYAPGVDLRARVTLLAEGARGSLSEEAMKRFNLRANCQPQVYGLGIKEVWEVPEGVHKPGTVVHTIGFPAGWRDYGGGFIYHMGGEGRRVALGYVLGLDYSNPHTNSHGEFQLWKQHPAVRKHIEGGTCLQYGARTINEGGLQSIPKLTFPGGALIGCSAGFLNVPKIKGTHTAMLSGMAAAEAAFRALTEEGAPAEGPVDLGGYERALQGSWLWQGLTEVRNIKPGFRLGLVGGMVNAAVEAYLLRGKEPWTLTHGRPDHERMKPLADAGAAKPYPKPDGKLTFDMATSLYRSGTNHEHNQPPHLQLRDPGVPQRLNGPHYGGPEAKYCPAGVYEYTKDEHGRDKLVINAQNCLHCKACDIKDPRQNIKWTVPEGGQGPNYTTM